MLLQESLLSDLTVATEPVTAVQICWASCADVNVWGLVTKLKDPQHFANFINSSEKHITNEEIAKHKYWISGKKSLQEENGLSKIVKSMFWSKPNHNEDLGHRFKCILCSDRFLGHRFNCHQCFLDPWSNKTLFLSPEGILYEPIIFQLFVNPFEY